MKFYARDLYPETGAMETSLLGVPEPEDQRVLENDEEATDTAATVTTGASKKGLFSTVAVIVGIIAVFGILTK